MDSERWDRVRGIFDHVVDKSPSHRADYLDIVCEDDAALRAEVERLLTANDAIEKDDSFGITRTAKDVLEPETVGDYAIGRLIGKGGMGSVYAATHERFGAVALKLLPVFLVENRTAAQRFAMEADVLGRLEHPALCRLYESFSTDDYACISMELIEGRGLDEVIAEGPLSLEKSSAIIATLAGALAGAHDHGVCHRDIKPGNVIITAGGTPKLIDFGIAKFADVRLTATGQAIGSPRYMSPEQWLGATVDARTDLWSLGIIWYEMLSARKPFDGTAFSDIAASVFSDEPPPLPADCVDGASLARCSALIGDLLQKDAALRPQSCAELLVRIDGVW